MSRLRPASCLQVVAIVLAAGSLSHGDGAVPEQPQFNKHIRPILAENCFKCHGADEKARKGKLRLDDRDAALTKKAIVPGAPDTSEIIKRILSADEEEVMPPPK